MGWAGRFLQLEDSLIEEHQETKNCPYCFEKILSQAIKCRFCHSSLIPSEVASPTSARRVFRHSILGIQASLRKIAVRRVLLFSLLILFGVVTFPVWKAVWQTSVNPKLDHYTFETLPFKSVSGKDFDTGDVHLRVPESSQIEVNSKGYRSLTCRVNLNHLPGQEHFYYFELAGYSDGTLQSVADWITRSGGSCSIDSVEVGSLSFKRLISSATVDQVQSIALIFALNTLYDYGVSKRAGIQMYEYVNSASERLLFRLITEDETGDGFTDDYLLKRILASVQR